MIYFIQITIYTALLYAVYLLFLRNRADHNWSRAYLLMNMTLPLALPFISLPATESSEALAKVVMPMVTIGSSIGEKASSINILPIVYIAVCCTLLGYLAAQLVQIALFLKRQQTETVNGFRLVRATNMGPGSWFSYIFIPQEEADEAVLQHERAHVSLKHSYDILLMRLVQCFAWPNLLLFVIAKELKTVHEFQADEAAGLNRDSYGQTLLNELFHTKHFALSHTFFHHPIKRRIMMLQNKARPGKLKTIALTTLLIGGIVLFQSADVIAQSKKVKVDGQDVKAEQPTNMPATGGGHPDTAAFRRKLYNGEGVKITKVSDKGTAIPQNAYDVAPQFDGDFVAFIQKNLVYPNAAIKKNIQGKVMTKLTINEQGEIETIDVFDSPDELLSKAASDVIEKMPRWKPGMKDGKSVKSVVMLPISFKL